METDTPKTSREAIPLPIMDISMRIGGEWRPASQVDPIINPYSGELVARAPRSTARDLDDALDAAVSARPVMAEMPGYRRAELLRRVHAGLKDQAESFAVLLSREIGKPLSDARAEVARTLDTLWLSSEESVRIEGQHVPLDGSAMGAGKIAVSLRFPVGVVAAITPFNAPLNLTAHKLGPAIAAGNTLVLKPPPQTPAAISRLVELFVEAGTPAGAINSIYGVEAGPLLVRDPRVDFISFTGSVAAGARIKADSGLRRVALELGGVGATIVHSDADVAEAAAVCARNSMRLAGQSCISVQNIYVHASVVEIFTEQLVAGVEGLKVGDPLDPRTDIGVLINEDAARRVELWIREAVAAGARLLTGGARVGAQLTPAVLSNVPLTAKVVCEEVFGPVCTVQAYENIETVFAAVSNSRFGLQTGVFTRSLPLAIRAVKALRTGAVILNGSSTFRVDQMPYGGVKDSGIGREGPRYAVQDMTDERLAIFNL